jgi:VWFA-related protein
MTANGYIETFKERPVARSLLLIGFCLFALSFHSLLAQEAPTAGPAAQYTLNARTTIEDVVVMDKSGHAVPNLRKEDFQVFENGKPQDITFFEPNFAATETAAPLPAVLPPNTFTNIPDAPQNNVTNILLLDALNTRDNTVKGNLQVQMVQYLASMPPNQRIGIFVLTDNKAHMIWGFDQDSSVLRAVVARFASDRSLSSVPSTAAQLQAQQQALRETADETQQTANNTKDNLIAASADALKNLLKFGVGVEGSPDHLSTTMSALKVMAHYLAGIPGRKNLFWLASQFPYSSKSGVYFEWYREARDKLTEAGVSVYPIDANGVAIDTGGAYYIDRMPKSVLRFADTEAWAEETGGKAYHANNIKQEIAEAVDHGSRYYTLAYVPSDQNEEGRERKVEVKVLSGKYTIFYRKSYFEQTQNEIAKTNGASAKNPLIEQMGRGMPNNSEIPYRLKVEPSPVQPDAGAPRAGSNAQMSGKFTRYNVGFQLQASGMLLVPDADGARRKPLEIAVMVYSQEGKPLNWESRNISLLIKPEEWAADQTDGIRFHMEIDAPPGDVYLRTGVYDPTAGKVGTLEIPLSAVTLAQK